MDSIKIEATLPIKYQRDGKYYIAGIKSANLFSSGDSYQSACDDLLETTEILMEEVFGPKKRNSYKISYLKEK